MKPIAFGIDFGTTNSIVAAWGERVKQARQTTEPLALWNDTPNGPRPHPSVVWYGPHTEPKVGAQARENMQTFDGMGHAFIRSIKRRLGRGEEVEIVGGQRKPAWEVAAEIFSHLKRDAEQHPSLAGFATNLASCVVTIPVNYTGRQRRDIRRALERAGMRLECFLHEPFAALVGHFYDSETKLKHIKGDRVLVFDWGGGTLDVCLAEVSEDGKYIYETAHDGIEDRAGDDFDKKIMSILKRRFLAQTKLPLDDIELKGAASDRFWIRSELGKIELSSSQQAEIEVPNFFELMGKPFDLREMMTREQFQEVIEEELLAAEQCVLRCLKHARITAGLVDHVLMVGGTSNIPAVRHMLERHFGSRVKVAKEPDAAIARGAAVVAAEGWEPYNVRPIAVQLADDTFFTVLKAGTPLKPAESRKFTFFCVDPRPATANLFFFEGGIAGDHNFSSLDTYLSVPTNPEIDGIEYLDRIVATFEITEDTTLRCRAQSGSIDKVEEQEIHDICFGLKLEGNQ